MPVDATPGTFAPKAPINVEVKVIAELPAQTFEVSSSVTILTQADTDSNTTYMTFIRLGDSV